METKIHYKNTTTLLLIVLTANIVQAEQGNSAKPDMTNEQSPAVQEPLQDIDLLQMEVPIVVTAARHEQKITTVPHAMSVITAEDIRLSGARNIPDALRLVPGMDVAELSYGNTAVGARGLHGFLSRETMVLVDGRQIIDVLFAGTLWGGWPFQLEDIERIEVIRGPGGVTWGANAVNGVINIITKDPADQLGLTFSAGGGYRGIHKEHLGYAFQEDKLRLRISGEYEAGDGAAKGSSFLIDHEGDYKAGRIGLHAIYEATPSDTLTLSAGNAITDGGFSPSPLGGLDTRLNPSGHSTFFLTKWEHRIEKHNSFNIIGYFNEVANDFALKSVDYRYQQLALEFGHTFKPADNHTITWGIDSRVDLVDASPADPSMLKRNRFETATIGLYIQDKWRFAPKWALNLGGRVDYEFYGGFHPSSRLALSYELNENSLIYGAVSYAYQISTVAQRYLHTPMLNGIGFITSDPNVDVESLLAYELGYRGLLFDRLETNLNLFWHEYDDLVTITPRLGPPGLFRYHLDNGLAASIYGVELDLKYMVTKNLTLLGNYTLQLLNGKGPNSIIDMDVISPPKHKFMLGARYSPTEDLHLSSHLYYVDTAKAINETFPLISRGIDPYFRLDLRAEHELWDDRASIAVGVRNLLDSGHFEGGSQYLNSSEVPRMIYAEFRMKIK